MTDVAAEQNADQENLRPWYTRLIELYFYPSRYFANNTNLGHQPTIFSAAVLIGVAWGISKVDQRIFQFELNSTLDHPNKTLEDNVSSVLSSWSSYWSLVAIMGLIGSVVLWYLGGWWYKKRLQWSGAADVCSSKARYVYVTQELVAAGPLVLITLIQTILYANYREAWQAQELWSSSTLVFVFWSCWVSYLASTTVFPTSRLKARLWFLIFPVLLNVLVFGLVGISYAIFTAMAT